LSGHVLELIATRIFYRFLKSHPVPTFKQLKTFHIKKQSLSFQNMVLKLWATPEMNLWEREIQGALE